MKRLLCLVAILSAPCLVSCDHAAAVTPAPISVTSLAFTRASVVPQTVHVIPFFDYGKSGYEGVGGVGGDAGLIGNASVLYGTTVLGGDTKCLTRFNTGSNTGCGIVYRLVSDSSKPKYKLEVLHPFAGAPGDGAASFATLFAAKNGDLYGTTFYGGQYNGGTLFKLHPNSSGFTETIVHSFGYGQDAAYPMAAVIEVNGILYGMTNGGGAYTNTRLCGTYGGSPNGCGTVYSVNPATGAEQVLHSFGKVGDGTNPYRAPLINVAGTLYGTTYLGGANASCGTVFSIGTDGSNERVIHSFLNAPRDGCGPLAGVINVNGTLYGTTCCGGGNYCPNHCEGTLFSVDLSNGQEQMLHEFGNGKDGSEPDAGLIAVKGVLYGTTGIGGGTPCLSDLGCGTIFNYVPSTSSPVYAVLHRFKKPADGVNPSSPLFYSQHAFFGTTVYGGKKGLGTGVKLEP